MKKLILAAIVALSVPMCLMAQEPEMTQAAPHSYHARRADLFNHLPVYEQDIVMLGNSITDGGEWTELFPGLPVKNRGISGDRTYQLLERLDTIVAGKPAKLFLLIGTNDLGGGFSPGFAARNIGKIIDRFLTESPSTIVYVQSVMPVNSVFATSYKHLSKDAEIVELNGLIREICNQKGVAYIDIWSALADENGKLNAAYSNDGLHLNGAGYLEWAEAIRHFVE